jgi:hypothetical protein
LWNRPKYFLGPKGFIELAKILHQIGQNIVLYWPKYCIILTKMLYHFGQKICIRLAKILYDNSQKIFRIGQNIVSYWPKYCMVVAKRLAQNSCQKDFMIVAKRFYPIGPKFLSKRATGQRFGATSTPKATPKVKKTFSPL